MKISYLKMKKPTLYYASWDMLCYSPGMKQSGKRFALKEEMQKEQCLVSFLIRLRM